VSREWPEACKDASIPPEIPFTVFCQVRHKEVQNGMMSFDMTDRNM